MSKLSLSMPKLVDTTLSAPDLPAGCPWQLAIIRTLLRGTRDKQSPLHRLLADDFEEIVRPVVSELFLRALLAEMLKANRKTTERQLRKGLTLQPDGSIDAWNLSWCKLTVLPELFGGVRMTGDLRLTNNFLGSLPESFESIKVGGHLILSNNLLGSLPESFGSIAVGGSLYLDNNQLSSLPASFGSITVGAYLGLSDNQLSSLPDSFGSINVHGGLFLDGNQLSSLPALFGSINVARDLLLHDNHLDSLPESFCLITVGGDLVLTGNPVELPLTARFANVGGKVCR